MRKFYQQFIHNYFFILIFAVFFPFFAKADYLNTWQVRPNETSLANWTSSDYSDPTITEDSNAYRYWTFLSGYIKLYPADYQISNPGSSYHLWVLVNNWQNTYASSNGRVWNSFGCWQVSTFQMDSVDFYLIECDDFTDSQIYGATFKSDNGTKVYFSVLTDEDLSYMDTEAEAQSYIDSIQSSTNATWIEDFIPPDASTTPAGVVEVGAYGNIKAEDLNGATDWYVLVKEIRDSDLQASVANSDLLWSEWVYPITTSGAFSFSTTTDLSDKEGRHRIIAEIRKTSYWSGFLSWFNMGDLTDSGRIYRKSGTFIIGAKSQYDEIVDLGLTVASSTEWADGASHCNPLSDFDVELCLKFLMIPPVSTISEQVDNIYSKIENRVPLGYYTRFMEIVSGAGTSTLPTFTYTFGSSSPAVLQGKSFYLDFGGSVVSASNLLKSIKADNSNHNIWDMFMPYWNILCGLAVFAYILWDLFDIDMNNEEERKETRAWFDRNYTKNYSKNLKGLLDSSRDLRKYNATGQTNNIYTKNYSKNLRGVIESNKDLKKHR